jgi:hypothetical protein
MVLFKLDADTIGRLTEQFREFMTDREIVHALLEDYVIDYRSFSGSTIDRYEHLKEKYRPLGPNLSHLAYIEEGVIYWSATDVSILLNRDSTSITRALRKIEGKADWCSKLNELRKLTEPNQYVYRDGIFDLLIDFYEEEYLQRFVKPRRGRAISDEEASEIYRFWEYQKSMVMVDKEAYLKSGVVTASHELPDIPPVSLKEIFRRITGKLFKIEVGAFFAVLVALGFELSRRFNAFYLWLPVISLLVFIFCVICIHRQKYNSDFLSNVGAGSLLFCSLWVAALLAGIQNQNPGNQPAVFPVVKSENTKLVLEPAYGENAYYFIIEVDDIQNVKEFFYCIKPDTEYRSTGFTRQIDSQTGLPRPSLNIPNEKFGLMEIDVKYADLEGKEQGPFHFEYDLDQFEMDMMKEYVLSHVNKWINVGHSYITLSSSLFINARVCGVIEMVMYGINKESPDTPFILRLDEAGFSSGRNPWEILLEEEVIDVQYVSAQIFFKDGTSTDIRIYPKLQ